MIKFWLWIVLIEKHEPRPVKHGPSVYENCSAASEA